MCKGDIQKADGTGTQLLGHVRRERAGNAQLLQANLDGHFPQARHSEQDLIRSIHDHSFGRCRQTRIIVKEPEEGMCRENFKIAAAANKEKVTVPKCH